MLYLSRPKPPQSWGLGKTWADHPKAVPCMRDFVLADIKRRWDAGNLLLGMAAVVDLRHISLEWLTTTADNQTATSEGNVYYSRGSLR